MSEATLVGRDAAGDPVHDEELLAALQHANVPTLIPVLVHLTGDRRWLEAPYRPVRNKGLGDNDTAGLSEELQQVIRLATYDAVLDFRAGRLNPVDPDTTEVADWLSVALDEHVPSEYGPLLAEELGLISRDVKVPAPASGRALSVLVIGAGMSGLLAAIKLKSAGIEFTVLEKNDAVAGAWLENTYPGCGVDTPSHLYSFSFARNNNWSRYFAKRPQVDEYFEQLASDFDVRGDIRFGTEVVRAEYEPQNQRWHVTSRTQGGTERHDYADVLIPAVGMVNRPAVPPLPGLETFAGPTMHTAEWRSDVQLAGKRVAVIGTGASAMQLVPAIVDETQRVLVFQRSKQWALPHPNYQREVSDGVKHLMDNVPYYAEWYRLRAFWNFSDRLHSSLVIDPEWTEPTRSINATNDRHREFLTRYIKAELGDRQDLLDDCLPDYPPYGKRPLIDNGWFRTVIRDDVDLITSSISRINENSITTNDGVEHPVDVIVLATGFKTLQFLWPMEIRGKSGRTLTEAWGPDDARAYLGITVPDFPNMFILNGPNTNAGHGGSAIIAGEFQMRYIMQALAFMTEHDVQSTEVRDEVFTDYNVELDEALNQMIWVHPGMTTYYRNSAGRVVVSSPWKYLDYWGRTLNFQPHEYLVDADVSTTNHEGA